MRANSLNLGVIGAAIVVVLSGAGCGANTENNTTAPSLFGFSTVSALASPEVSIFNVEAAGLGTDGRGPCVFDQGTGRFGCDDSRRGGLSFSRTVTFFDANGVVQAAFDPETTASIKTETSVSGTVNVKDGTATINRSGVMVVSGLEGAETTRTLNGSEQGTVVVTGTGSGGVSFNISHTVNDTTVNLVVPVPRDRFLDRKFPVSGTRTHATTTVATRGTETKTDTRSRKETFNGTAIVQIELTINGVTQNCEFNLVTHRSTCQR
jgi:hypothetical protein